jgi:hypothetical protein
MGVQEEAHGGSSEPPEPPICFSLTPTAVMQPLSAQTPAWQRGCTRLSLRSTGQPLYTRMIPWHIQPSFYSNATIGRTHIY